MILWKYDIFPLILPAVGILFQAQSEKRFLSQLGTASLKISTSKSKLFILIGNELKAFHWFILEHFITTCDLWKVLNAYFCLANPFFFLYIVDKRRHKVDFYDVHLCGYKKLRKWFIDNAEPKHPFSRTKQNKTKYNLKKTENKTKKNLLMSDINSLVPSNHSIKVFQYVICLVIFSRFYL